VELVAVITTLEVVVRVDTETVMPQKFQVEDHPLNLLLYQFLAQTTQ
jgi:hypothetical protein